MASDIKSTNEKVDKMSTELQSTNEKVDKLSTTVDKLAITVNESGEHVREILEAVKEFSNKTEERFEKIEATMVTKDYLDEKLGDLRGDLVVMTRKEDTKLRTLISLMQKKQMISNEEAQTILTLEPFPILQ